MKELEGADAGAGGGGEGGGGSGGAGAGGGGEGAKTVAYENFQRVVEAKTGLEAEVRTLKGQLQTLTEKAATVDTLSGQVNEWKGKAEKAERRFTTYTEFAEALGTQDADVIGTFDGKYETLPEKERPSRSDWVKGLKEKPDGAPSVLRPWLGDAGAGGGGNDPARKPPPKNPAGSEGAGGTGAKVTAEQIEAARQKGIGGDWSEWKALRKQMGMPERK